MARETIECPVCQWKGKSQQHCPQCGWQLESGYVLGGVDEQIRREWERRLQEARTRWQAQQANPFGGDCCLGITTEEAEVFIDGYSVGTTRNCYLLVEHLRAGRHRVEAKARYGYGVVERELAPGDVRQCEIKVEPGKGFLRVLSEVGVLTLEVDGRSYRVPARIEVEAGRKELRVKEGGSFYKLYEVEVLPGQTAEVRVTRLQQARIQARIKVAEWVNLCLLTFSAAGVLSFLPAIIMLAANFFFSAVLSFIASVVTFATTALLTYLSRDNLSPPITTSIPVAAIYGSLTAVAPQWAGFLGLGVCLLGAIGAALASDEDILDRTGRLIVISICLVAAGAHGLSAFFWNSRTV